MHPTTTTTMVTTTTTTTTTTTIPTPTTTVPTKFQKLSPVSYRFWMPGSCGIHPILNIAHLEKYQSSPAEFGECPTKNLNQEDFNKMPEYEVKRIITERKKKGKNGRQIIQ
jgi:hypothetical protein